jgi:RNA-dependent RNA polymerase
MAFVQRPFVIMNHVFRAFTAKDSNVFFVETFEEEVSGHVYSRPGRPKPSDPLPFLEFIDWHNPLDCNNNQVCHVDYVNNLI